MTRDDLLRIEDGSEKCFDSGKIVGDYIKKYLHISFRTAVVIVGIVVLGSLFFFAGLFSGKKEKQLEQLNK